MFWHGSTRIIPSQDDRLTDFLYHFQPLSASTTIRLIKVLPRKVWGCIACKVFHFNETQQEAIKYHALSYVWGDSKPTRQIYLQDESNRDNEWRPFPLHENLWQFLDHAWRSKLFDQLFWTDYLCLDQKGHEEISQQVPRMYAIYRNAELVIIWLQLQKHEQKGLRRVMRWGGRPKLMPKVLHRVVHRRLSSYEYAIRAALDNPYWGRVWIVQEVVVAKKVRVTTGDISIGLDELRTLVDTFVNAGSWAQGPSMWVLCDMRAVGGKVPLWRILRDFKRYQSTRPADRVFGMLGMVEDHEDGSSPVENISVDYDKPIRHVLLDAIFESSPPLAECRMTIHCLGPEQFHYGFSLLRRYIRHMRTMRRHRIFARIALQALEAFSIIKGRPDTPHSDAMSDLLDDLFSSAAAADWRPTLSQSAALIGLVLSSWNKGPQRDAFDEDYTSPWRCAAHESYDRILMRLESYPMAFDNEDQTGLGSYEIVAGVSTTSLWASGPMVDACGRQSQGCDGSIMAFEIPHAGLRLQVEPGIDLADATRLSLYSKEVET